MTGAGLIVAAPGSGHGKTTVTLGILRALARRGLRVRPFKAGPDYLDPMLHRHACGQPGLNLDCWAMRLETLADLADRTADGAELVVGEGFMGLFDGAEGSRGSTGELASLLDLPVVLVVDAYSMAASAAAVVEGFIRFRDDVDVAAVIFNRVGGKEHARILRRAADDRFAQPVLGCLPHDPDLVLPERHLGLLQPDEVPGLETRLERLADTIDAHLDTDRLLRIARPFGIGLLGPRAQPIRPIGQRIAVARDRAFAFIYEPVLDGWRTSGAEILPFSPLAGEAADPDADAIYLPGGYPELHASRLAANARFLDGLHCAAARGTAIYGECGGFMVLGQTLIDADGTGHAMAGLLPVTTSFERPQLHLGYRRLRLRETGPLGGKHATFRGHTFHFACLVDQAPAPPLFDAVDVRGRPVGPQGARVGSVAGSFLHLIDRSSEPEGAFEPGSGTR